METWTIMIVMGVARSVQNFNLKPIRYINKWLWQVSVKKKRVKCDSDLGLEQLDKRYHHLLR